EFSDFSLTSPPPCASLIFSESPRPPPLPSPLPSPLPLDSPPPGTSIAAHETDLSHAPFAPPRRDPRLCRARPPRLRRAAAALAEACGLGGGARGLVRGRDQAAAGHAGRGPAAQDARRAPGAQDPGGQPPHAREGRP